MSTAELQPESVVARYVTVGGATVDLTVRTSPTESYETVTTCTGCPARDVFSHYETVNTEAHPYGEDVHRPDLADAEARGWAQSHAEKCRAMPRVGVES